jgi:hypothetical protein
VAPLAVGVHEKWTAPDNGRMPGDVMLRFPGSSIGRAFVNAYTGSPENLRPGVRNACLPYLQAEVPVVYVSVKTPRQDTRNGLWDGQYRALADHIMVDLKTEYPNTEIRFIPHHEPEDDMTGLQFQGYFHRVRDAMKGAQPDLKIVYCAMAYQWAPNWNNTASIGGRTNNPAEWQVTADEYAVDVYSGRSFPLDQILPEHPGFRRWLDNVVPAGVVYSVTERGFETPSTTNAEERFELRNETIEREFNWLKSTPEGLRCANYIYWNSSGTEQAAGLKLDPSGEDVLAAQIASLNEEPPGPTEEELLAAYNSGFAAGAASRGAEITEAYNTGRRDGIQIGRQQGVEAMRVAMLNQFAQILTASTPIYE